MEKSKDGVKSSISSSEFRLLQAVLKSEATVFSAASAALSAGFSKSKAFQLIHSLHRKGLIERLEKNKYALAFFHFFAEPMAFAASLVWPGYVSFWSALAFYGFTEQLPNTIFVATSKRKKSIQTKKFSVEFVPLGSKKLFGYAKVMVGNQQAVVAEKEKALVDSVYLPRHSGGLDEAAKALFNAWQEIDKEKLVEYCLRMGNKSLNKRMGYLIELMRLEIKPALLQKLHNRIGKGFSKLNPAFPKAGKYEKKWLLQLNEKKLLEWRKIL